MNPLRPVNFNKHHFSIFSHFNRSSATVLNIYIYTYIYVVSVPKYNFSRVAMQFCLVHTSAWVFCKFAVYFQCVFAKALLSLIVHFKGTFTYFYQCFIHDPQIFNVLQHLLILCISNYIFVSCVHNLSRFYSFR